MTISYTFTPLASLAYPNADYTYGLAINDSGQIVGAYGDVLASGEYSSSAFLYSGGTYTNIDPVGGYYSAAFDISNDGKVLLYTDAGSYYYDYVGSYYVNYYDYYVYDNGTYTLLTNTPVGYLPGDVVTVGTAISDAGVVGYSYDPVWYADGQAEYQGFLFENGVYTAINVPGAQYTVAEDINDLGQVVGYASYNGGDIIQGFLYDNGVFTTIADPNWPSGTVAQWINNDGEIVGYYYVNTGLQYFIDDNGVFTDINVPGASQTIVEGISDAGVFGEYTVAYTGYSGFIYKDGVYTTVDDSWSVTGMSASGQQLIENWTEIATLQVVADPTVVADHDHVNLYQTVVENAAHGVLANDTDPISTDALSVSAVNGSVANIGMPVQGLYGALTLAADGSYSYTASHALPDDGVGFDTFSYTAETGTGGQATTDLTIVVVGSDKHYLGGTPDTTINGGAYNFDGQVLDGSQGNDILIAGSSPTVEIGGPGDTLTGSTMADKFVFHGDDFGRNEITNFNVKMDTIWFDSTEFTSYQQVLADATQVGNGKNATTIINDGTGDVIQLDGVKLWTLTANDFHFA